MAATEPLTGRQTKPTKVVRNKDGSVSYPNDPHINVVRSETGPRPATRLSGYARGGTTNPSAGESGEPTWFSPDGEQEDTPQAMFERDRQVNPVPHRTGGRFDNVGE